MISIPYPRLENGSRIQPLSMSVNLKIDPLSTASITLGIGEEIGNRVYMELFTEAGSAGWFRTRSPSTGVGQNSSSVELDHAIAEVGDSIINGEVKASKTFSQAVSTLWGYYKGSRWQLGSVASGNTAVVVDASYDTVLDGILELMEQVPDVMMSFNFSTSPWTVNIVAKDTTVSAEGRLGRNVKSAQITTDDSELCTRVYMEYLPGSSGKNFGHIDADTISTYGLVEKQISGAANATQASEMAGKYLAKHKRPQYSIRIEAIDLSNITGETLDTFRLGKKFRLALPDYGITVEETLTEISYSSVYGNTKSVSLTLNESEETLVKQLQKMRSGGGGTAKKLEGIHYDFYSEDGRFQSTLDMTESQLRTEFQDADSQLSSSITQTASQIRLEVSNSLSGVYSTIEQTASQIRLEVHEADSALNSSITQTASQIRLEVNNSLSGVYSSIDQTASQIRLEVHEADSALNSSITQTASQIRLEVNNSLSGVYSSIEQTASQIRLEVNEADSALNSSITQTASQIRTEVNNSLSGVYSSITQQADKIALVVTDDGQGGNKVNTAQIVAGINAQTGSYVKIQAAKINLSGYVTASELEATDAKITNLEAGTTAATALKATLLQANTNFNFKGYNATWRSFTFLDSDNTPVTATFMIRQY